MMLFDISISQNSFLFDILGMVLIASSAFTWYSFEQKKIKDDEARAKQDEIDAMCCSDCGF